MAEISQFTFDLREVIQALIVKQNLHEGIWTIGVEFGMGAGNVGVSQEEVFPSAFVQVKKLGLIRAPEEGALALDAAKINPFRKASK